MAFDIMFIERGNDMTNYQDGTEFYTLTNCGDFVHFQGDQGTTIHTKELHQWAETFKDRYDTAEKLCNILRTDGVIESYILEELYELCETDGSAYGVFPCMSEILNSLLWKVEN